jgi:hypothetical protein
VQCTCEKNDSGRRKADLPDFRDSTHIGAALG